ncbi:hypothetical protein [Nostoc sp.]
MVAELSSQLAIAETAGMIETTETADMTDRKLGIWGRLVETV